MNALSRPWFYYIIIYSMLNICYLSCLFCCFYRCFADWISTHEMSSDILQLKTFDKFIAIQHEKDSCLQMQLQNNDLQLTF